MLKMFAVIYRNNSLGLKKTFPCNYKGMEQIKKHFDKLTIGNGNNAIIMGHKTERQLPILPKRESIILGKKFKDFNEIDKKKYEDLWIIGGEKTFNSLIYHHDLKQIHTIEIDQDILSDSYFPEIPLNFKLRFLSSIINILLSLIFECSI